MPVTLQEYDFQMDDIYRRAGDQLLHGEAEDDDVIIDEIKTFIRRPVPDQDHTAVVRSDVIYGLRQLKNLLKQLQRRSPPSYERPQTPMDDIGFEVGGRYQVDGGEQDARSVEDPHVQLQANLGVQIKIEDAAHRGFQSLQTTTVSEDLDNARHNINFNAANQSREEIIARWQAEQSQSERNWRNRNRPAGRGVDVDPAPRGRGRGTSERGTGRGRGRGRGRSDDGITTAQRTRLTKERKGKIYDEYSGEWVTDPIHATKGTIKSYASRLDLQRLTNPLFIEQSYDDRRLGNRLSQTQYGFASPLGFFDSKPSFFIDVLSEKKRYKKPHVSSKRSVRTSSKSSKVTSTNENAKRKRK